MGPVGFRGASWGLGGLRGEVKRPWERLDDVLLWWRRVMVQSRGLTSPLVSSTKQMLVDVIQSQPGDSLPEILWTPASEHEVGQVRLLLGTHLKTSWGNSNRALGKKLSCSS